MAFDFSVLEAGLKKKRELKEKERQDLLKHFIDVLANLREKYNLSEAFVFGSIVKPGRFIGNSDLDVAVKGLRNDRYFEFVTEISDKMSREVDVVELEKCRFAEKIRKEGIKVG
ncbi:MAG: nucleotidyltransferase domain-containing protein [bacterium]